MSKHNIPDTEKMILASEMLHAEYHTNGWVFFDPISTSFRLCLHEIAEYEFLRLFEIVHSLNIVEDAGVFEVSDKPVNHYVVWFSDGNIFPICDADGVLVFNV